jgi:TonB family protein
MKHALLAMTFFSCVLVHGAAARPSNYFYRISPASEPLKTEFALYAARPDYPIEARRRHLEGGGLFAIQIRPAGAVEKVKIVKSTGHGLLDQAAIAAFRQWRFRPNSLRTVKVPIRFVRIALRPTETILRELGDGVQITVSERAQWKGLP